jgi:ACT domain-containing protein
MRVIITVIGKDTIGIIAKVSALLAAQSVNIQDISQTVFDDLFAMVMLGDMSQATLSVGDLSDLLDAEGQKMGMKIITTHEDIFNHMHRI